MPISVDTTPHARVINGSHIRGLVRFKAMFEGISNSTCDCSVVRLNTIRPPFSSGSTVQLSLLTQQTYIADEEERQSRQILVTAHIQIVGKTFDARVGDIAAIKEG